MKTITSELFIYEIYNNKIVIFDLLQDKTFTIKGNDYINLVKELCVK